MSDSAVLTTAMSSMSIAVAIDTTASVQRLDGILGESFRAGRSTRRIVLPPEPTHHPPRGRLWVVREDYQAQGR